MLPCHSRGCDQKPSPRNMARRFALLAVTALPLCLGGCKSIALGDITGSIGRPDTALPTAPDDVRRYTQAWEKQYDARPNDKATVMAFARGLRAQGQYAQAVAILQKLALKNPEDLFNGRHLLRVHVPATGDLQPRGWGVAGRGRE